MSEPVSVVIALLLACAILIWMIRSWRSVAGLPVFWIIILLAMNYVSGYPTKDALPDELYILGLTNKAIWAISRDNTIPRAYQFVAPPSWHEEKDRRKGEGFWVKKREARGEANKRDQPIFSPGTEDYEILKEGESLK